MSKPIVLLYGIIKLMVYLAHNEHRLYFTLSEIEG